MFVLFEFYLKGLYEVIVIFEVGDLNLDKEKVFFVEVILKKDVGDVMFGLVVFYIFYEGFIFRNLIGFVCGEEFDMCGIEGMLGVEDELI